MRKIENAIHIIKEYGAMILIKGMADYFINFILKLIFKFDRWHVTPVEFRPYATDMIRKLNSSNFVNTKKGYIVEIGCGLGDILGHLKYDKKIGFDISDSVLRAAAVKYKDTRFKKGSFQDVKFPDISVLIMVNFIHQLDTAFLKGSIQKIADRSFVHLFVIDTVVNSKESHYLFEQKGEELFRGLPYELQYRSREYKTIDGAERHIEYWKHQ